MGRKPTGPKATALDMDLEEFARHTDEALMRETGLATHVQRWRKARDTINQLGSDSEFAKTLNSHFDTIVGPEGYARCRGLIVRRRHVGEHTKLVVRSEAVKKKHPELWMASRAKTVTMGIKGEVRIQLPPNLRERDPIAATKAKAEAKLRLGHAQRNEAEAKDKLLTIAAGLKGETGWDGDPPYQLRDGWVLGWKEGLRYSETLAREKAPEFGIDVADLQEIVVVPARFYYTIEEENRRDERVDEYEGDGFAQ